MATLKLPSRAKKKRRIALLKKVGLISFGVAILFVILIFTLNHNKLSIVNIEVVGTEVINQEEIKTNVSNILSEKYFYLVSKKNILFYPKNKIEDQLKNSFKRILDISIGYKNIRDPRTIVVKIKERTPSYLWCDGVKEELAIEQECYFVDDKGVVFDVAPIFSENVYVTLYGNLVEGGNNILGKTFLPESEFLEFSKIIYRMSSIGLISTKLIKQDDSDYELDLARGGKILFSLKDGGEDIMSNLESALITDPLKTNLDKRPETLLYIDLRFGNKVFFKFK